MTLTNSESTDKAIAGFCAGVVSTCVLHPLDMIKTRFQINQSKNKTLLSTFQQTSQKGIKSLYRGLSANMLGASTSWGFYFYIYQHSKDIIQARHSKADSEKKLSPGDYLLSSSLAGVITVFLTNPIWVVKTRMCATEASSPNAYQHVFDGLLKTYRIEGVKGLYKGLGPALFGVSHGAIQFLVYEQLKRYASEKQSILNYITMAVASKVVATCSTYPYQVIKARMQNESAALLTKQYEKTFDTAKSIWRGERIGGFYKGLGANLVRVLPGTCITFAVYEGLSKIFQEM